MESLELSVERTFLSAAAGFDLGLSVDPDLGLTLAANEVKNGGHSLP
jgi:hypothetical protein